MASAACPARSRAPLPRSVDPVSADNAQPVCAPRQCRWLAFPAINPPASCLRSSAYATVTFGISFRLNGDRTPLARPRQKDIPIPARPRAHTPLGEAVSPTSAVDTIERDHEPDRADGPHQHTKCGTISPEEIGRMMSGKEASQLIF